MRVKGASEEEIEQAQIEAAEFLRDNLLTLGPSFVKVGGNDRSRLSLFSLFRENSHALLGFIFMLS